MDFLALRYRQLFLIFMQHRIILFLFVLFWMPAALFARTYYLSNAGNDANAGTSLALAWRTTTRVNAARLLPGDRVLLAGGQVFTGSLWIHGTIQDIGNQPIIFSSYGSGRATIQSGDSFGFYAHNVAGIELRQLAFVGSGRLSNRSSGVMFYLDSANVRLQHLRLDNLEVSGYQAAGISIGSWNGGSGYDDVRITNCQSHANGQTGINAYAYYPLPAPAHHNWYVGNCATYDNSGRADVTNTHTGSGIVLSGIDGALIEKCTAYHNGWLNTCTTGGPVGIWAWACNNLVIQLCEAHHNLSGTAKDGGGFDLDGGCTNSVMQYNYSHDNQGPGYLLAQFPGAPAMHDLIVRYNISENDARGYGQGAIELWSSGASGGIVRADIYNNTVCVGQPADGSLPKAFCASSDGITGVALRNNILQTGAGLPVLAAVSAAGLRLQSNCYWSPHGSLVFDWGGTHYATLEAWRAATGQETLGAGTRPTGICADPRLTVGAPGASHGSALAGYNPSPASGLVGAGLNLMTEFDLDPDHRDFFGNATPASGVKGNMGASEAHVALATQAASGNGARNPAWCQVYPTVVRDEIHVLSELSTTQTVELQLLDPSGHLCRSWSQAGARLQVGALVLPVAELAAGRYMLQVQCGSHLLHQALIVGFE